MEENKSYKQLLKLLAHSRTMKEWDEFLHDLLTPRERASLAERWQIVQFLSKGIPQRDVAKKLGVSISKITRGSKVLQKGGFKKAL